MAADSLGRLPSGMSGHSLRGSGDGRCACAESFPSLGSDIEALWSVGLAGCHTGVLPNANRLIIRIAGLAVEEPCTVQLTNSVNDDLPLTWKDRYFAGLLTDAHSAPLARYVRWRLPALYCRAFFLRRPRSDAQSRKLRGR